MKALHHLSCSKTQDFVDHLVYTPLHTNTSEEILMILNNLIMGYSFQTC